MGQLWTVICQYLGVFNPRPGSDQRAVEMETNLREDFTISPTRTLSWLKEPTSTLIFKNLLIQMSLMIFVSGSQFLQSVMVKLRRGPSFPALVGGVARDCAEISLCPDITTWARGICAECRVRGAGLEKRKLY